MNKKLRIALTLLLAAVFLVSTGLMLRQYLSDRAADNAYSQAQALALSKPASQPEPEKTASESTKAAELIWVPAPVEEEDPYIDELAAMDLTALREVNADVVGWILIPDTKVNYPILQGEDNEYYLKNTWDHQKKAAGSIFLECMNSADFTDFNTIVYGHNMNSGSMFASLRKYTSQSHWEKHPYVYILTDAGAWRYEIFSAYKAPVESYTYGLSFQQQETKEYFIKTALEESQIDTGVTPAATDRILTLSTCSGAGYTNRWVVHARLDMVEIMG